MKTVHSINVDTNMHTTHVDTVHTIHVNLVHIYIQLTTCLLAPLNSLQPVFSNVLFLPD